MKFRKKPVIIDAIKWNGNLPFPEEFSTMGFMEHENGYDLEIDTLEGTMICRMGDYIIKGIKGEFYPCKPDIFELTYEKLPSVPVLDGNAFSGMSGAGFR